MGFCQFGISFFVKNEIPLYPKVNLEPIDEDVLKEFYKNVRPWGFWKPIHDKLALDDANFKKNEDFGRDMFNVFVGIIAQTTLVVLPMYIIFRQNTPVYISIAVLVICGYLLKKFWWNTLDEKLH